MHRLKRLLLSHLASTQSGFKYFISPQNSSVHIPKGALRSSPWEFSITWQRACWHHKEAVTARHAHILYLLSLMSPAWPQLPRMGIGFSEVVDAFYGKTDGRSDCRDRTKKYLICNYWGQQEFSFDFKGNGVMTLFFSALRGFRGYPETSCILHFPGEHIKD